MHISIDIAIIGLIICHCIAIYREIKLNNDEIKAKRDEILKHSRCE